MSKQKDMVFCKNCKHIKTEYIQGEIRTLPNYTYGYGFGYPINTVPIQETFCDLQRGELLSNQYTGQLMQEKVKNKAGFVSNKFGKCKYYEISQEALDRAYNPFNDPANFAKAGRKTRAKLLLEEENRD